MHIVHCQIVVQFRLKLILQIFLLWIMRSAWTQTLKKFDMDQPKLWERSWISVDDVIHFILVLLSSLKNEIRFDWQLKSKNDWQIVLHFCRSENKLCKKTRLICFSRFLIRCTEQESNKSSFSYSRFLVLPMLNEGYEFVKSILVTKVKPCWNNLIIQQITFAWKYFSMSSNEASRKRKE